MDKNLSDKFETTRTNPFNNDNKDNFFMSEKQAFLNITSSDATKFTRHINDYDSTLLEEDAYKNIENDTLKMEYKISKIEKEIRNLDSQIQAALEIHDYRLAESLYNKKLSLEKEYSDIVNQYNNKSISAKISEHVFNTLTGKKKIQENKKCGNKLLNNLTTKLPEKFASLLNLKNALTTLENINKNVDNLMTLNIPYGENLDKYEKLSKYIIKANSIQNEISKNLKNK
ncbi:MAG: hypothetical protein MJ231_04510 [bacterium]|nr:hypothetical protein [bacterium]